MATNPNNGGASASPFIMSDFSIREALERGPKYLQEWWDQLGEGETELERPACKAGCATCYRECALRHIHARAWGRRYEAAMAQTGQALTHEGRVFLDTEGEA